MICLTNTGKNIVKDKIKMGTTTTFQKSTDYSKDFKVHKNKIKCRKSLNMDTDPIPDIVQLMMVVTGVCNKN